MTADQTHLRGDGLTQGAEHRLDCREALERLSEFLDAELPDADGMRIREHLADCEPCLAEYDVEDHIKKLVRRSCTESAPLELHVRIRTQLIALRIQQVGLDQAGFQQDGSQLNGSQQAGQQSS